MRELFFLSAQEDRNARGILFFFTVSSFEFKNVFRVVKIEYRVVEVEYRVKKSEYRVIKSEYRVKKKKTSIEL